MASIVYNSALEDMAEGRIDFDTDTFKILLVTSSYTPNKDSDTKRSDVSNEVTGTGYTSGGDTTAVTVTKDTANDRLDIDFGNVSWSSSTITARAGVIYKARGGLATADELVAYLDFGADITSTNGTFTVDVTSPLRLQN